MAWAGNSNLSNSDSTNIRNHFLHCFNNFIDCLHARATRTSIIIDIFSTFLKPVILQLNLCSVYSRIAKRHSQHFKCLCIFNFIFSNTKLKTVSLNPFFRILVVRNRRAHQNMTNLFICETQTDNLKWLILPTYVYNRHVYQHT